MTLLVRLLAVLVLWPTIDCHGSPATTADLGATVHGQVLDENNVAIAGATVSQGTLSAQSDAQGNFSLLTTEVGYAGTMVMRGEKVGYAQVTRRVPVAAGQGYVQFVMRKADLVTNFTMPTDPNVPVSLAAVHGDTSSILSVSSGSLQDPNGNLVAGEVQATLTMWSPNDLVDSYSGTLRATLSDGTASESSPRMLRTYGMVDILLQQDGQTLQIVPGQSATLDITTTGAMMQNYTTRTPAYAPPTLWTLDTNTGLWNEDVGDGVYDPNTGTLHAVLHHLSTKNSDEPITESDAEGGCIRGKVVDLCNKPVAGASVTMYLQSGLFWGTTITTTATTDTTGTYAMTVNPATHMGYFGYASYTNPVDGTYLTTNTINSMQQGFLPNGIETTTVPGDVPEYEIIPMAVFLCSSASGQCVDSACQCFNDVNDSTCLASINIPGSADGRNPCWVNPMGNDVYGNQCFPQYNMYKMWQGVTTGDLCSNCWPLITLQLPLKLTPNCTGVAGVNSQTDACASAAASTIRGEGQVCSVTGGDICCPSVGAGALTCEDNVCVPVNDPTAN